MKRLESIEIDFDRCWDDLAAFSDLLDRHEHTVLTEQQHILPFFRQHRNIAALIGHLYSDCVRIDRIAYEFDIFGDHAADLVAGDASRSNYGFIEFEDAAPDSIFRREAGGDDRRRQRARQAAHRRFGRVQHWT